VTESPQSAPKANGLQTVLNTIAAPKEAFEALREAPTWGWALLTTLVLIAISSFLMVPAIQHSIDASWAQTVASNPRLAGMSEDKLASAKTFTMMIVGFSPIFVIVGTFVAMLIQTMIMLIFNAIGRGSGTFKSYWAASWNIAVVAAGIGSLLLAIIIMLRGVDSFATQTSVQAAMPSLGWLAPHLGKLTNFLGAITIFSVWAAWLVVMAMSGVGRVSRPLAWITGGVSLLLPSLFALLAPAAQ
jgi:hypothetical protein